ncbi:hypothetical protein [Enterococcus termitis]|jgi:hypothetical protein|uniref:Uncharacterized protein n=1 Tax=Enterococcus termitis TaxID=332950 RepID=A0A1E5GST6_9ENTE|nr:hypothetical protein [Enterococcus termitis]OEG15767.1 hypothetical protein BCR25_18645 [Enterococcus termitis]OJG96651.1 hypothetical protein RV18_GL002017 [Enterococcus termitis]
MPIKNTIALIFLVILALNFFIRGIRYFYKSSKIAFSKDTYHTFLCENCTATYKLDGLTTKGKIKFAPTKKIDSIGKTKTMYKFTCPECGKYVYQQKIFDTTINKGMGLIRIQADQAQSENFKELFIKCILPTIIGAMFFRMFLF